MPTDPHPPDQSQLTKAHNHCLRSMYEAADAGIISALDMIRIFQHDYRTVTVSDIIPSYPVIVRKAREAKELLAKGRKHREDDFIVPDRYVETFHCLVEMVQALEDSREELNKKIKRDRRFFMLGVIGVFSTVLGIIVAL